MEDKIKDIDKALNSLKRDEEQLIKLFSSLNVDGKRTAIERVGELSEIPKYKGDDNSLEEGDPGAVDPKENE